MTYTDLWQQLATVYDTGEAKAIVRYVLDVRFHLSAADVYCGKVTQLSSDDTAALEKIMHRLAQAEPVQYVLGEAGFCGHTFRVAPGVLIPRPETEELVADMQSVLVAECPSARILDVGTGSGCIAVSMALALPDSRVTAWDISADALRIAADNARQLGASVRFVEQDALRPPLGEAGQWDAIVSNPPYICRREKAGMERNVLDYEPGEALFVPDDDPLLFYRAIARYGVEALSPGGWLWFEINPLYADSLTAMLRNLGYGQVETKADQFGKQRFVKTRKP